MNTEKNPCIISRILEVIALGVNIFPQLLSHLKIIFIN